MSKSSLSNTFNALLEAANRTNIENRLITSKDAYMLVYARKGLDKDCTALQPPDHALKVVHDLNEALQKSCEEFEHK